MGLSKSEGQQNPSVNTSFQCTLLKKFDEGSPNSRPMPHDTIEKKNTSSRSKLMDFPDGMVRTLKLGRTFHLKVGCKSIWSFLLILLVRKRREDCPNLIAQPLQTQLLLFFIYLWISYKWQSHFPRRSVTTQSTSPFEQLTWRWAVGLGDSLMQHSYFAPTEEPPSQTSFTLLLLVSHELS